MIGTKSFKAWSTGDTGDVIDVSVILGPALDKCPDPRVVISKALENAGISARNIEVVNITGWKISPGFQNQEWNKSNDFHIGRF